MLHDARDARGIITRLLKSSHKRVAFFALIGALGFLLTSVGASRAQSNDPGSFFKSIVGEWIGVCEQSTDGQQADNKYFHVTFKEAGPGSFVGQFNYYRVDRKTGKPLHIGDSTISTTIDSGGTVHNSIVGKGSVLINETDSKDEEHQVSEVLTPSSQGSFSGKGEGKISVFGMPLGFGKNGKVQDATSSWAMSDGVLTINQKLKAKFKALFVGKSFSITANSTAKRGTDVFSLMGCKTEASRPVKSSAKRSVSHSV